ncbi:hypothetical protein YC2023_008475 [Brassica napus]
MAYGVTNSSDHTWKLAGILPRKLVGKYRGLSDEPFHYFIDKKNSGAQELPVKLLRDGVIRNRVDNGLGHFSIFFDTIRHNLLEGHFVMFLSWFGTNVPLASLTETKAPKKKVSKNRCGRCREEGHNRTNCTSHSTSDTECWYVGSEITKNLEVDINKQKNKRWKMLFIKQLFWKDEDKLRVALVKR